MPVRGKKLFLNILINKKQWKLLCLILKIKCAIMCAFDFFYCLKIKHCRDPTINQF